MHPYIPHLLEDIANAHRCDYTADVPAAMSFEEEMEALENWLDFEAEHPFGYHCGLDPINFPPHEQLKVKDIRLVNRAFKAMMLSWNLSLDLPVNLPARMLYSFNVGCLSEKVPIVDSGIVNIDYCSGDPATCSLKKYCLCKNGDKDDVAWWDEQGGDIDLPF